MSATNTNTHHWHVTSGLANFSDPENVSTAADPEELADILRYELGLAADFDLEGSVSEAQNARDMFPKDTEPIGRGEAFERAYELRERSDETDVLRANLDNARRKAPLYAGRPDLWHETILTLVRDNFPWSYDSGRCAVSVWECQVWECQETHPEEED